METPREDRIMGLVHSCSDMSADERDAYLSVECAGEPELRREVEALLDEDLGKTGFRSVPERLERDLPSHYRLIKLLGSGGMAEVFLAEDTRLGRLVAIKFLNSTYRQDADLMRRFDLEARSASALNHPNIITIYDIGEADGIQYIVSEHVDGETLGTRITRGRMTVRECVTTAISIASALSAAHAAGIVHRDLKPENIMLRADGNVKVLDFGLAKASGGAISGSYGVDAITTSPGLVLGTPAYMSPEQARGLPLDGRSDIFSLGIMMFEMLTGRAPFKADSAIDIIAAILTKEPRDIFIFAPDAPTELVRIISKALEKDRGQRYPSAQALLEDLEEFRNTSEWTSSVRPAPLSEHAEAAATHAPRRAANRWKYAFPTVAIVVVLIGGGWFIRSRSMGSRLGGPLRTIPVTSWSSLSAEDLAAATFSPDAKWIAFATNRSGATEIWAKPTAGGDPIQVTKNGFYNRYPVWAPNNNEIAFFSKRGAEFGIWRAPFTGGQETRIAGGVSGQARPLRWTADGKVFYQDDAELYRVDLSTGERVVVLAKGAMPPRTIAISPDVSTVAVAVKQDGEWKLKSKRLDQPEFIDLAASKTQIDSIAFDPGDGSVLYTTAIDGTSQIFRTRSGSQPQQISHGSSDLALQDVSSDGSQLLCSSVNEVSDLWLADSQGIGASVVANDEPEEFWPDLAADNGSVVYQSVPQPDKPFGGSILARSQLVGGTPTLVSPDGFAPVWSTDGQWIAFFKRGETGISIWKARSTGADQVKLVEASPVGLGYLSTPYLKVDTNHLSWSPDSASIAFSMKLDGVSNIWRVAADGSGSAAISSNTDRAEILCCAVWTRDGSQIAFKSKNPSAKVGGYRLWSAVAAGQESKAVFASDQDFRFLGLTDTGAEAVIAQPADPNDPSPTPASTHIYVVSLQTGARREIRTIGNAYFENIQLSKNGQVIGYVARTGDTTAISTVPVIGGVEKRLWTDTDPKVMVSSLALTRDGRAVVFGKQMRTNVLSILTN